jgi:uncharacterized protein
LTADEGKANAVLRVRVRPRARTSGLVGRHGEGWKLHVRAPAERGRANAELLRLLGSLLGVAPQALEIVAGAAGRDKVVAIQGLAQNEVERRLAAAAPPFLPL